MALAGDPLTDFLNTLVGLTGEVAKNAVDRVVINTKYGPPVVISGGAQRPANESPDEKKFAVRWPNLAAKLQPEILVYLKDKADPVVSYAPHGAPGSSEWPWVRFVALFAGVTLGYFVYRGVTRPR